MMKSQHVNYISRSIAAVILLPIVILTATTIHAANNYPCSRWGGAGNTWIHWTADPTFVIDTSEFTNAYMNEIEEAATEFANVGGVARSIQTNRQNTNVNGFVQNQRNDIGREAVNFAGRAGAVLWVATDCQTTGRIIESDIIFNETTVFTTQPLDASTTSTPQTPPIKPTAMHEFGHAMGLGHDTAVLATVNFTSYAGGHFGSAQREIYHSDDRGGFRDVYGNGANYYNSAASEFWKIGSNNSIFEFTVMTSNSNFASELPSSYPRSGAVRVPYHIENHSNSTQDLRVRFYASTNSIISTSDTEIGIPRIKTMGPATTVTSSHYIPNLNNLQPRRYWFGYIVDRPYTNTPEAVTGDQVVGYNGSHVLTN